MRKTRGFTPLEIWNMMCTYVLKSNRDGKWYTGSTKDLRKRFREHNDNKVFSTKNKGPFELIYCEACINEQDARTREKYLKSGMGKRYLKNRMKRFLSLTGFTLIEIMIIAAVMFLLVGITISSYRRIRANVNESAAANHLRIINNGLLSYHMNALPNSYPESLHNLTSDVMALSYIDSVLASGQKQGYQFNYTRADSENYALYANPVSQGVTGERYFYTDDTGVIRYNREVQAGSNDSALD